MPSSYKLSVSVGVAVVAGKMGVSIPSYMQYNYITTLLLFIKLHQIILCSAACSIRSPRNFNSTRTRVYSAPRVDQMITCKFKFTTYPAEDRSTSDTAIMKQTSQTSTNKFSCFMASTRWAGIYIHECSVSAAFCEVVNYIFCYIQLKLGFMSQE